MKIIHSGKPHTIGLELECFSITCKEPTFISGETLARVKFECERKIFGFFIIAEDMVSVVDGSNCLCLEIVTDPVNIMHYNALLDAVIAFEAALRTALIKTSENHQLAHILSTFCIVEKSFYDPITLDHDYCVKHLNSTDALTHCQVNLGFSQLTLPATAPVLTSFESALSKILQTQFTDGIVCSGMRIDYAKKGAEIKRDTICLISYCLRKIRSVQASLGTKCLILQQESFQQKLKFLCWQFVTNLHQFTMQCSYPAHQCLPPNYLQSQMKYSIHNRTKPRKNSSNFGAKDFLPILMRPFPNVFSEHEVTCFESLVYAVKDPLLTKLRNSLTQETSSVCFPDINRDIIIECRYPKLGLTYFHDATPLDAIKRHLSLFLRECHIPELSVGDIQPKIPARLQLYLQSKEEEPPLYLKGMFKPYSSTSSGHHKAARIIQGAYRSYSERSRMKAATIIKKAWRQYNEKQLAP